MNWFYILGCEFAVWYVFRWITDQLHAPLFVTAVISFAVGWLVGGYFGKVETLAKKQAKERQH